MLHNGKYVTSHCISGGNDSALHMYSYEAEMKYRRITLKLDGAKNLINLCGGWNASLCRLVSLFLSVGFSQWVPRKGVPVII